MNVRGGGGGGLPYKNDRTRDAPQKIWKETPTRHQEPVLWAWLEKIFTPKMYKQHKLTTTFSAQCPKRNVKGPTVDPLKNTLTGSKTSFSTKRYEEYSSPSPRNEGWCFFQLTFDLKSRRRRWLSVPPIKQTTAKCSTKNNKEVQIMCSNCNKTYYTKVWEHNRNVKFLESGLPLSFYSSVALIFTTYSKFVSFWWIASIAGKFTRNIKGPITYTQQQELCYGLWPLLRASA